MNTMKISAMCKLQNCVNQEEEKDHNNEIEQSSDGEIEEK